MAPNENSLFLTYIFFLGVCGRAPGLFLYVIWVRSAARVDLVRGKKLIRAVGVLDTGGGPFVITALFFSYCCEPNCW